MATIAVVRSTGQKGVVLGTGYGMYQSSQPSPIFGNFGSAQDRGQKVYVALCNSNGDIGWFDTHDVQVVEIDGKPVQSYFADQAYR